MKKSEFVQVDLFIVGQPKSGTTALALYLDQHPHITMAKPKEPHYFATDFMRDSDNFHGKQADFHIRTPEDYAKLFTKAHAGDVLGEASTNYLYSKEAAKNIKKYNPDAKIIIMLREPVSFLQSLHSQYVNEAIEDETNFIKALDKEKMRRHGHSIPRNARCPAYMLYSERVKYVEPIQRYLALFPRKNIIIISMHEIQQSFPSILQLVNVDPNFTPDFSPIHERKKPRFAKLNHLLHHPSFRTSAQQLLGQRNYTLLQKKVVEKVLYQKAPRSHLPEDIRHELMVRFKPEVEALSTLLGRDFTTEWGYDEIQ